MIGNSGHCGYRHQKKFQLNLDVQRFVSFFSVLNRFESMNIFQRKNELTMHRQNGPDKTTATANKRQNKKHVDFVRPRHHNMFWTMRIEKNEIRLFYLVWNSSSSGSSSSNNDVNRVRRLRIAFNSHTESVLMCVLVRVSACLCVQACIQNSKNGCFWVLDFK